ncbi:hypothetical protein, partial [Burkholderia cenocepacia]|uniref:hypothetical protein n=1 Tax=Burkholderia cenocepacia TaxID=95486 RepID=UPI001E321848
MAARSVVRGHVSIIGRRRVRILIAVNPGGDRACGKTARRAGGACVFSTAASRAGNAGAEALSSGHRAEGAIIDHATFVRPFFAGPTFNSLNRHDNDYRTRGRR